MKEQLLTLSKKIKSIKDKVRSEEATKQSMVLPLLHILGYDIFNPEEVIPEVHCDIANKGDKVDYVLSFDGKHEILIECKECHQNLNNHVNQLRKYFVASESRFAILTNGMEYLFFSDHKKSNIMDEKPFYSLDMLNLTDKDISFINGFGKDSFNKTFMLSQSQDISYQTAVLQKLKREFENPSRAMIRWVTSGIYDGKWSDSIYNKFSQIIKDCLESLVTSDNRLDDEVVKELEETSENRYKYTEDDQRIVDIVLEWLKPYETDKFHIYVRKLSDGYIRFCYSNEWWNICRIKVAWDKSLYVKICREALAVKSERVNLPTAESLEKFKTQIVNQCIDTKDRFFKYRKEHNI